MGWLDPCPVRGKKTYPETAALITTMRADDRDGAAHVDEGHEEGELDGGPLPARAGAGTVQVEVLQSRVGVDPAVQQVDGEG